MTDEELQTALLQPAAAQEPVPEPESDVALQQQLLQPVADPMGPARDNAGRIYVIDPMGELGTVDEATLPTLASGYQLAPQSYVEQAVQADEYGDIGSQAAAFGEGAAQGATLGLYGAAASALAGDEYDRERRLREQHNPVTSVAGNVVGAVAPALLSGGTGAAGAVSRALPSAIEANLGAKLAAALGERAAGWTASKAAQIGARMAATGLESAADQAIRTVLDDAANGDVDITAERMLDAAWKGAAAGAGLELGLGAVGAASRALGSGAKKVAESLGGKVPSLSDAAGEAAYKAAVGRTDVTSQRLAQRAGGSAAVGHTLLENGIVRMGDTLDEVAERLPGAREVAGQELGALLEQVGGGTVSKQVVRDKVADVLARYNKAGQRDVAEALSTKLEKSGIWGELVGEGDTTLRQIHELRRNIDARPDLKWGSAGPNGVDLTTEGMRDIRRAVEEGFEEASDTFAKTMGIEDFAQQLKAAKKKYQHIALAADQAEEGVLRRSANQPLGLKDVIFGAGAMDALGGVGGMAVAVGSKLARQRYDATAAAALYGLSKKMRPPTVIGQLADDAARAELALDKSAAETVARAFDKPTPVRTATTLVNARALSQAMDQAFAMQDPKSPESAAFAAQLKVLGQDDPALASTLKKLVDQRVKFLGEKMPPPSDPNDPLGMAKGMQDGYTARKNMRYVQAAVDPQGALKRLASGQGTAEDIETLRALTPRLYQTYVQRVQQKLAKQKRPPTIRERRRLAYAIGTPLDSASMPESVAWFQTLNVAPVEPKPVSASLAPAEPSPNPSPSATGGTDTKFTTATNKVLARGG